MVVFPNAKINIGLQILGKRDDGFHDIKTSMFPLSWCDVLELVPATEFSFEQTGHTLDSEPGTNLVEQAFFLFQEKFGTPNVNIHLHKIIPAGAGLGGGSSDAAFCLTALNELFETGIDDSTLEELAGQLGSDCPFFVQNLPALATGRGTELEMLPIQNRKYWIEVIVPPIHINTGWAYRNASARKSSSPINLDGEPGTWTVSNDFESVVFEQYPEIQQIKSSLTAQGALYSSLSGSGSTLFGLFDNEQSAKRNYPGWSGWISI